MESLASEMTIEQFMKWGEWFRFKHEEEEKARKEAEKKRGRKK